MRLLNTFKYAEEVLPPYVRPKTEAWIWARNSVAMMLLVLIGLFYGLAAAILPVSFYIYMLFPMIFAAGCILWAMPDTAGFSGKPLRILFFTFLYVMFLWPNYLAISLPGLPWITINRLVTAPLALLFLYYVSTSADLRAHIIDVCNNSKFASICLASFIVVQCLTLPFSSKLGASVNRFIDIMIQWNMVFFIGCYVFSRSGNAIRWISGYCVIAVILPIISLFEWRKGGVLWAEHIPSFLAVGDESVQKILAGGARAATGIYRLQSVFSTSLNYAEFLALSTPFFLYFMMHARRWWLRLFCVAFIVPLFWTILKTDSRLGMIGFFVSIFATVGVWGLRKWKQEPHGLVGPAFTMAFPFLASLFLSATLVSHRLGAIVWGNGPQSASNEGRRLQWIATWPKVFRWPLGNGTGTASDVLNFTNLAGVPTVDSYYIVVLLEYGVLGFVLWLGFHIGFIVKGLQCHMQSRGDEAGLLAPAAIFLFAFLIIKGVLAQDDSHAAIFMVLSMICGVSWRIAKLDGGMSQLELDSCVRDTRQAPNSSF